MTLSQGACDYEDIPPQLLSAFKQLYIIALDRLNRKKNYTNLTYTFRDMEQYEFFYRYIYDMIRTNPYYGNNACKAVEDAFDKAIKVGVIHNNYCPLGNYNRN